MSNDHEPGDLPVLNTTTTYVDRRCLTGLYTCVSTYTNISMFFGDVFLLKRGRIDFLNVRKAFEERKNGGNDR
jgi:hypothetical protein